MRYKKQTTAPGEGGGYTRDQDNDPSGGQTGS